MQGLSFITTTTWQLYPTEILHAQGHHMTAAVIIKLEI
jgi:hypothetical protein